MFRYEIIWDKKLTTGFLDANRKPMRRHENICVFYYKQPIYHPQKTPGKPYKKGKKALTDCYGKYEQLAGENPTGDRYPTSILEISNANRRKNGHPTEKPLELLEYLVKTYTNEGDLILDNCLGSGTTALAAKNLGRNFIGIELEEKYCRVAAKRVGLEFYIRDGQKILLEEPQ